MDHIGMDQLSGFLGGIRISSSPSYGADTGEDFDDSSACVEAKMDTQSMFGGGAADIAGMAKSGSGLSAQLKKVKGIRVRRGHIIDGIQAIYADNSEAPFHGSRTGGSEAVIVFDEGDELKSIEGSYGVPFAGISGGAISRLTVRTKKGKIYGPHGNGVQSSFRIEIPEGGVFAGFHGKASKGGNGGFLARIGLLYGGGKG
ncbi:MAG: hypothetical protein LBQ15_05045 [Clostridium sp.]|jgi:hypothetical protein|nr:hypothetical protein [Clostridium sp.]